MIRRTLAFASLLAGGCTTDTTVTAASFQRNNGDASSTKAVAGGDGMVQWSVDTAPDASASESSVNNNVSAGYKTKPRNSKLPLSDLIRCGDHSGPDPCKPPDTINITIGGETLNVSCVGRLASAFSHGSTQCWFPSKYTSQHSA